jgi:hypothetical protein
MKTQMLKMENQECAHEKNAAGEYIIYRYIGILHEN